MRIATFILATGCALGVAHAGQANVPLNFALGFAIPTTPVQVQYVSPSEARDREARLGLSQTDRRDIQRALQDLGYRPGYSDGYFGARTRAAITAWQEDNGLWPTGYVSRAMLRLIDEQRYEEPDETDWRHRADLAYWEETGASNGSLEGMRRYLQRYPDGYYADHALNRLTAYEKEQRREDRDAWREAEYLDTIRSYQSYLRRYPDGRYVDEARRRVDRLGNVNSIPQDHQAWQRARQKDTVAIYKRFLRDYPDSTFAPEARARLKELKQPKPEPGPTIAELEAEEKRVLPGAYQVQEFLRGLRKLGYRPSGRQEERQGMFSEKTREVIRTIQRKTGRPVTGYADAWMVHFARHAP